MTKNKPFINKYKLEGINFASEKDDCKNLGKNNVKIAFNVLYAKNKNPAYVLFMLQNITQIVKASYSFNDFKWKKLWHYLAAKKLKSQLRRTTSKNNGDFYWLNCLHPFRTKETCLNCIKEYVKIKIF